MIWHLDKGPGSHHLNRYVVQIFRLWESCPGLYKIFFIWVGDFVSSPLLLKLCLVLGLVETFVGWRHFWVGCFLDIQGWLSLEPKKDRWLPSLQLYSAFRGIYHLLHTKVSFSMQQGIEILERIPSYGSLWRLNYESSNKVNPDSSCLIKWIPGHAKLTSACLIEWPRLKPS